jgi:outer membrane protein assembly factor BamB
VAYKNLFFYIFLWLVIACQQAKPTWELHVPGVVSSSSPQAADLNADGTLDIVQGAGAEEWKASAAGIVAINGATGQVLWVAKSKNQIVGSAVFQDINKDGSPDVFIGGRSAELQAIDGRTGHVIWEFYAGNNPLKAQSQGWYNFFNAVWVPDQDNDGLKDLVICNGGDATLAAGSKQRPPGTMLLISAKSGHILAQDQMPDGAETYCSPVVYSAGADPQIVFGTGGESQAGHLYICTLSQLKTKNLAASKILASAEKGFIAIPQLADFNADRKLDIEMHSADGQLFVINGSDFSPLAQMQCDSAEVYSNAAIGLLCGNDQIPDIFVTFAKGSYPLYKRTESWLINGKTFKKEAVYPEKRFSYCSPLVLDTDNDNKDEVLQVTLKDSTKNGKNIPYTAFLLYNFHKKTITSFGKSMPGASFASTPLLKDIDGNGLIELFHSTSPAAVSEFPGSTTFQKPLLSLDIWKQTTNLKVRQVKKAGLR